MARWAIGDIQGCVDALKQLLQAIKFNGDRDELWLCGDLVNRGPDSLATLRLLFDYREQASIVLGNHDLHLLAVMVGGQTMRRKDTFADVLSAPDRDKLSEWLMQQRLAIYDVSQQLFMSHAGLPPPWSASVAVQNGDEVMQQLRRDPAAFFSHMYGNEPADWRDDLHGVERWRYTVNGLTRMRFVDARAGLDLNFKGRLGDQPATLTPWFRYPNRREKNARIIFGHWAAIEGKTDDPQCIALDTGCVWGGRLTAYQLDSEQRVDVAGWQAGATLAADD